MSLKIFQHMDSHIKLQPITAVPSIGGVSKNMRKKGIIHHKITPLHPKANSTAETFMRNLKKTLRRAKIDGKPLKESIFDFLLHYRITPHSSTLICPSEALYNRKVKDNELTKREKLSKNKTKIYFDKRFGARDSCIKVGACEATKD